MNQDLTQELAAAQAELVASKEATARAEAKIAAVQAELAKLTPWARWKPGHDQRYFFVNSWGKCEATHWLNWASDEDRYNCGNCFPTEKAAERHAKRLRSMVPTCPVPKVGEDYWAVIFTPTGPEIYKWPWRQNECDKTLYSLGRVGATEEAAQAWIDEYADAWTTLEDAS